jgi:hypothetical protein
MTDSRVGIATPTWRNALGEPVDLDNIDREYALNILTMVLLRRGMRGYTDQEIREDPLVEKLRDVVLNGREKNVHDRLRAKRYNLLCKLEGLPYRARR